MSVDVCVGERKYNRTEKCCPCTNSLFVRAVPAFFSLAPVTVPSGGILPVGESTVRDIRCNAGQEILYLE